ncbi:MAG: glycosyltransferase [Clostridia bacterium]|nr:glycosyltransferase [Clostridia bacterium]
MKILMLTDRMEAGGAETHIAQLALGLQQMGVEVAIASSGGAVAETLGAQGIKQIVLPLASHNPFLWLRTRRQLRRLVRQNKFDILHAHARIPAFLMRGLKKYGCAEIVTVHAKFRTSPLLRLLANWGEHTVAVSEDLRAYVCKAYPIPREQVRVIANGIDCNRFSPRTNPQKTGRRILFASRMDRDCARGAELLCQIAPALAERFADLHIGIAGGGDALSEISAKAEEINRGLGREAVTVYGHVSDMAALWPGCDIAVGVSRAAMEGAACGAAVVLCGNEGYLGILNGDNLETAALTNFCCRGESPADAARLGADLTLLLENSELRRRCADACRAWVTSRCNTERMCRETLALYHRCIRPAPRMTVTVGGYFGCGNLGDDAILQGFLEELHHTAPEIGVIALSGHPHRDRKRFGIPCINRNNPFAFRRILHTSDAFLCGGGSLLQNTTSNRSLSYYLSLIRSATRKHKPAVLYSAGIGPLVGKAARTRTASAANACNYISLRDPDSMRFLENIGVDRALLHLGADPALLMPLPPASRAAFLLQEQKIPPTQRYICVALRSGKNARDICRIITAALRMVCREWDLLPVFLVFDGNEDPAATERPLRSVGGRVVLLQEASDAIAYFSRAELTVAMRLHALILSTLAGTPAVGIPADGTDPKIASFAQISGQEHILPEELSVALLVEKMEELLRTRASRRPILTDSVSELRKKAKKDLANIVTMIYNIKGNSHQSEKARSSS